MIKLPWIEIAKSYIGLHEGPGAADNPVVVGLYAKAGFPGIKHDSVPWCAAFVGACLKGADLPGSNSLAARSYEGWGVPVSMAKPVFGAVAVKKRAHGKPWEGHVGFLVAADEHSFWLLSGNASDRVGVDIYPRADFTALRWPGAVPFPDPPNPLPRSATSSGVATES